MACHEIAALRLFLHRILGTRAPHERDHEVAELGPILDGGPLAALSNATDFASARRALEAAAGELDAKVSAMSPSDPQLGYYRSLVVTVRATQRSLDRIVAQTERFYLDIEDTHDLLHEVFPGSAAEPDEHPHHHDHDHDHEHEHRRG
jgi:hypothetical protein